MSATIPDTSEREKLMPFVGSYVEIAGEMYQRSGIKAIVIEQIKKADHTQSHRVGARTGANSDAFSSSKTSPFPICGLSAAVP